MKPPTIEGVQGPRQIADEAVKDAAKSYEAAKNSANGAEQASKNAARSIDQSPFREIEDREFLRISRQIASVAEHQAKAARDDEAIAKDKTEQASGIAKTIEDGDTGKEAYQRANQVKTLAEDVARLAADAGEQSKAAIENAKNVVVRIPDPPIDSISHSVQFIVTAGASVAPSWTLVRFRGPTGNLASVTATQTHTLNIALGPRGDNGARYSQEAVRALQNLTIQQIRLAP